MLPLFDQSKLFSTASTAPRLHVQSLKVLHPEQGLFGEYNNAPRTYFRPWFLWWKCIEFPQRFLVPGESSCLGKAANVSTCCNVTTLTIMALKEMPVRLKSLYSQVIYSALLPSVYQISLLVFAKRWLGPDGIVPGDSDLGEPFYNSHLFFSLCLWKYYHHHVKHKINIINNL